MYIKMIHWLSEEAKEAEVILASNGIEITCFSHPCFYAVGDEIEEPLGTLDCDNIVKSLFDSCLISKTDDIFQYHLCGVLENKNGGIVSIGGIKIEISYTRIPKDIKEGDYIEFDVSRLDLY